MVNGIERTISFLSGIFTLQLNDFSHGHNGHRRVHVEQDMRLDGTDYFEIEYERIGKLRNYICDEREHDDSVENYVQVWTLIGTRRQ